MKGPIDPLVLLYQQVQGTALKTAVSTTGGAIYLMERPDGSVVEDIVINGLPLSGDQRQLTTVNVNIYVPDIRMKLLGKTQTQPYTARLKELTDLALINLSERYAPGYCFWVAGISIIPVPETNQHYVNLRIDFEFDPV